MVDYRRIIEGICPRCEVPLEREVDCGRCPKCNMGWSYSPEAVRLLRPSLTEEPQP